MQETETPAKKLERSREGLEKVYEKGLTWRCEGARKADCEQCHSDLNPV